MREGKVTPVDPGFVRRVVDGVKYAVMGSRPTDWFGPGQPMRPTAPEDVKGRAFDYQPGFNLGGQPRQYEPTGFAELRTLADGWDLLRLVIETRKDQIEKLTWSVQPRRRAIDDLPRQRHAICDEIEAFFRRPDRENTWQTWLRVLLEDLFVIDAPALYPRLTYGGRLYSLDIIDGATIKRLLDETGRTPAPPLPAYQQVLKGLPAVDYTTDELLYRPRNKRSHKVYGFSPVEQIVMTVNIALRRQISQLSYFTEGNVPEALIGVPETWSADQIAQFQAHWDALLAGDLAARRHAKFIPGGLNYHETRQPALNDNFDEWLARVVCFAFSIPAMPFMSQMNRAAATSATEAALSEGLAPLMVWIKDLVDEIIARFWGRPDLEFRWGDHKEVDPANLASINSTYVRMGIKSIDEARAELGLDPLGMKHAVFTGNGALMIDELKDPVKRKELMGMMGQGGPAGMPGAPNLDQDFGSMSQLLGATADHATKDDPRRNAVMDLNSQDEGAVSDLDQPGLDKLSKLDIPFSGYP